MITVIDTNVIVSALLRAGSIPEAVLSLALNRIVQLCVSEVVLAEYQEVLGRPKLSIDPRKVANALSRFREVSILVTPSESLRACSDPDDNIFLECVEAGKAEYLVTGNRAHFPAVWAKTQIVTPREFIEKVIDIQRRK